MSGKYDPTMAFVELNMTLKEIESIKEIVVNDKGQSA